MNEVQRALETAFQALSVIPVTGDGVELMATARASLRAAYRLAEDKPLETAQEAEA